MKKLTYFSFFNIKRVRGGFEKRCVVVDILGRNKKENIIIILDVSGTSCYSTLAITHYRTYLYVDDNWNHGGQRGCTLVSGCYVELDPPVQSWIQGLAI